MSLVNVSLKLWIIKYGIYDNIFAEKKNVSSFCSCIFVYNYCVENRKEFPKQFLFASWPGAIIKPQWLELPTPWTNLYGCEDVRAIKVRLYSYIHVQCSQGLSLLVHRSYLTMTITMAGNIVALLCVFVRRWLMSPIFTPKSLSMIDLEMIAELVVLL